MRTSNNDNNKKNNSNVRSTNHRRRRNISAKTLLIAAAASSSMTATAFVVEPTTDLVSSSFTPSLPKCHLSTRLSVGRDMTSPHRRMASSSSSRTSSTTIINQETTQLSYRMGNEDDSRERQELHREAVEGSDSPPRKWLWTTGTQVPSDQMLIDKYLENIDRRYHRLHDDDKAGSIGWTWNWLMAQPSQPQPQEEDALRVLELADLASERLLKQHKRKQKKPTPVVDVVVSEERPPSFWTTLQKRQTIVTLAARRTIHKMLRRSTQALTKAPSALVASVLSLSGAKKTALVILSLLVFLLKPLSQA